MTLEDLIDLARQRLDDTSIPPRRGDTEMARYANEAVSEAAIRARLLRDETTDSITLISLVADTATYTLHRSVFDVDRIRYADTGEPITRTTEDDLDARSSRWRTQSASRAREFFISLLPGGRLRLTLTPAPTEVGDIRLAVYRKPKDDMELGISDEPEISSDYHMDLVDWLVYRGCQRRDPDLYDPVKAADHLASFTARFGEKPDANVQRKHRQQERHVVRARDF